MPAHKHAALMALYAQDAAETETPWERWEWRYHSESQWKPTFAGEGPSWSTDCEFRRKPRTININGHEVPEPVREPLNAGTAYWTTSLNSEGQTNWAQGGRWSGDFSDRRVMERGLVHLTREAAEAHARALLSFTETKETA